jgi:peptidoglycan/LPS O-acetylase OafA/YrhL
MVLTTHKGKKRFHDLDALRGYAMLLGIVLHGLMSFIVIPFWPAQDRYQSTEVAGAILLFIHGFRLPLFFLISGFFTAMLWRKRGLRGLFKQRAIRILIPLMLGTVVTWVLMLPLSFWGNFKKERIAGLRLSASSEVEYSKFGEERLKIWELAQEEDVEGVMSLIAEGSDVNAKDSSLQLTGLAWAVIKGNSEMTEVLIRAGADVNARDGEGNVPLHAASFFGRAAVAELLITAGADVNARNNDGETPLDSQRHGMGTVNWIADMLEVEIRRVELNQGRKKVEELLVANGGETGIGSVAAQTVIDLWKLGAQIPVFQHLWFLYYLCWLVLMFGAVVLIRKWIQIPLPGWIKGSPWCWLWLLPATLLFQLFMKEGVGADTAPGILPWPPKLFYYAVFFSFGALCYRNTKFEKTAGRFWILWSILAIPAFVIASSWLGQDIERWGWDHWAGSFAASVFTWLMIYAHLGFFRRFFSGESRWVRYLSDSAYWLYLAHLPLVLALQIWVSDWDWPIVAKVALIFAATTAILLFAYEFLIRYSFIGAVLNGRKKRGERSEVLK